MKIKFNAMKTLRLLNINQLICLFAGFSAITSISVHIIGWLSLQQMFFVLVLPSFLLILNQISKADKFASFLLKGWISGLIAVFIYDLSRIPFMMYGWGDFIPTIGDWLLGTENTNPIVGYAWRYFGNGGGLGISFAVLSYAFNWNSRMILKGFLFGMFVWFCLDLLLIYTENGQNLMFKLTPLSVTGSFVGHFVYGVVLGFMFSKLKTDEELI